MQQTPLVLMFMVLVYLDKSQHCSAAPLIDSKSGVDFCITEGDLLGDCKQSRFCFCDVHHKWVCSFDVRKIFGDLYEKFKDICTPCDDICGKNNILPTLNVTLPFLFEQEGAYSEAALADICNVSEPCLNNGTCESVGQSYICHCEKGWNGTNCELDVDECLDKPCGTNADECINTAGSFRCICPPGLTGDLCMIDVNECNDTSPGYDLLCFNNGSCVNSIGSYTCNCSAEWTGTRCEIDVDECLDNPCDTNATDCINTAGSFRCICPPGLTGDLCMIDMDECLGYDFLCFNNGSCVNSIGSYTCNCSAEWTGSRCEIDVDECLDNPCGTNAVDCINTAGSFRCICPPGLTGDLCMNDVDECNDTIHGYDLLCFNDGSCENSIGSYTCNCSAEWTGSRCEIDVDECNLNVCPLNTSESCINACGSFKCICMGGWTGELCLEDINECDNTMCLNGGICHNTYGSFLCNCTAEWGGPLCDYPISYAERIIYWNNPENHRRQIEYLNVSLQQIKSNLSIDKNLLTSERIKRISAPDRRTSAAITGYIGAGVLSFVFGLLLCFDITVCCAVRKLKR